MSQDFQLTCIPRLKIAWIVSHPTQIAGDNIKINGNGLAALKELQWNLDLTKGQGTGKCFFFAIIMEVSLYQGFFTHCTITGVKKIVRFTEAFFI